ncbi:MAG: putative lipid II flippase FtsW [Actinomycetes bacterium]
MTSTRRPDQRARSGSSGPTKRPRRTTSTGRTRRRASVDPATLLVVPLAVLAMLGVVMVYSASSVAAAGDNVPTWSIALRQMMFLGVGLAGLLVAARIPLRIWRDKLAGPVFVLALGALFTLAALVVLAPGNPLTPSVNGAHRWLGAGPLMFQPSELAKPALILWLARLLDVRSDDIGTPQLLRPLLVGFTVLAVLVLAGDDMGTTALLSVIMLVMIFMAGMPTRTVASIGGAMGVAGLSLLMVMGQFRRQRILAFLNMEKYRKFEGWQLWHSQIALASGGWFGVGLGGSKAKWGYLGPEAHTDFILAVIGEELGIVGVLVIVACFVAIMVGGARIALTAPDQFGRLVAVGVTSWIGFQALINIGVNIGTLPTKGITLPFVSYGGSSLVVSLAGLGLLLAVARDR